MRESTLTASCLIVLALMQALYAYGTFGPASDAFGIDALRGLTVVYYVVLMAMAVGAFILVVGRVQVRLNPDPTYERPKPSHTWVPPSGGTNRTAIAILIGVLCWPVFYVLRSKVLNADGNMLTPKFLADVPRIGAYLTHDEILEFFVHSRFWHYTNDWWGWSVVFSYRVLSCVAGGVFVAGIVLLARRIPRPRTWLFLAGVLSGGYMQLFFGDAENYTLTAAILVFYVLAAVRFIAGEAKLWLPSIVLAVAICFHLEAGWLLPSWLYLAWLSKRRTSDARDVMVSATAGAAVVLGAFVYFHFNGLPLWRFFSSHAGNALRLKSVFAIGMPSTYYIEQLNLLVLLCPSAAMLVPLALKTGIGEDTTFLAIAAASMLVFQAIWKAQLGVADDWNLYAIGGMVLSIFIWWVLAAAAVQPKLRVAAAALAATGALHSYAWIVANHRHG